MNRFPILASTLALAVLLLAAGCSRQYYSRVRVMYQAPAGVNTENALRALLPKNDRTVQFSPIRNTDLYDIGVYDRDPQNAAKRANELVATIQASLEGESAGKHLMILERAVPPTK